MSAFRPLALRIGLLRVREADLSTWEQAGDVGRLADAALTDQRRRIRRVAIRSLGRLACRESVAALRRALADRARSVALAAAEAIRPFDGDAADATERWWQAHDADLSTASHRQLINKSKMERFAVFKKQVLAQANKGRFYG